MSYTKWKNGRPLLSETDDGTLQYWKQGQPLYTRSTFYETRFDESSPLDDWTEIWETTNFTQSIQTSTQTGQVGDENLYLANSSAARSCLTYDPPGTSSDQEVLTLVNLDDNAYNYVDSLSVHLRTGGGIGSENGYLVRLSAALTDTLNIIKYVDGSGSTLDSVDFTAKSTSPQMWIRFRVEGTTLKVKLWAYNVIEPDEWLFSTTDSDISSGKVGLGTYTSSAHFYCEYFAADMVGGTIPVPTLTSGTLLNHLGQFIPFPLTSPTLSDAILQPVVVSEELDGMYVDFVQIYTSSSYYDNIRYALYKGTDKTDPNGAALVEDFGVLDLDGNTWNQVNLTEECQVSYGDILWLAFKSNDGDSSIYRSVDFGHAGALLCNGSGRYLVSAGMDTDETVAYPSTLSGLTGSAYTYAYGIGVRFSESGISTTTTTTTTVSTTTTTTVSTTTTTTFTTTTTTTTTFTTTTTTTFTTTTTTTTTAPPSGENKNTVISIMAMC